MQRTVISMCQGKEKDYSAGQILQGHCGRCSGSEVGIKEGEADTIHVYQGPHLDGATIYSLKNNELFVDQITGNYRFKRD